MASASMTASLLAAASALWLSAATGAVRVVSQPEGAYEVLLADVVLPGSTAGYVIFRPCGGCGRLSLAVGAGTVYSVDGASVPFAEFVAAAEAFRDIDGGGRTAVYVYYAVDSGRVNRLAVDRLGD